MQKIADSNGFVAIKPKTKYRKKLKEFPFRLIIICKDGKIKSKRYAKYNAASNGYYYYAKKLREKIVSIELCQIRLETIIKKGGTT